MLVGASGFIGRAVRAEADLRGIRVVPFSGLRVEATSLDAGPQAVASWRREHPAEWDRLRRAMCDVRVVINAAGLAAPGLSDSLRLWGPNVLLPQIVAEAAVRSGVRRLVHVSSAVVQGSRPRLDETRDLDPFSPYARSKAAAEAALLDRLVRCPPEIVVYRPTSVQGENDPVTRRFARMARLPVLPVADGDATLPVALPGNVGAAALHLVDATVPEVVLHPWEQMTVRRIVEAFGARPRFVALPGEASRRLAAGARRLVSGSARLTASFRRYELVLLGQAQDARHLADSGFELPYGPEGYEALGRRIRAGSPREQVR